ncbi:hypothetical protein BXP70_11455 [Hymenobacter crusticola]|uniref:NACHT domain-containing protein n=2 Tax=Hymenobacter crusticola TaxID=1770526 RepID=A0A243WD52_9BACT|nr:hypothetical protein BXP70_11455 [Hymenobacter crusticola]
MDAVAAFLGREKKKIEHDIINKFSDYLNRTYEKQSYLKTVVFQNEKRLLKDLYIPLTVLNSSTNESVKIDSYPKKLLPIHDKVLLVDTAGMGKSTISRFIFLKAVEGNCGVPVFLELRQLKAGLTVLDLMYDEINGIKDIFDKELLLHLIEKGDFIFIFDGFDEIPLKEREFATQHLQDFISKVPNNKFLITSRQDNALTAFADFQRFVIRPLRQVEAYDLLRKYDGKNGETAEALIAKLEEYHKDTLKSFLVNPLLVSLLFKAYDFKPTLPLRADNFYRQVYEALFENHDLSKGGSFIRQKRSGLNIDDFARVLRAMAMKTVVLGKVQYTTDELLLYIKEAKERCVGLSFSESDFIKDIIQNVPLFVQDGLDIRWNHKSFQEYFAAMFIAVDAKGSAESMLKKLVNNKDQSRFVNILELYYDIDPSTFQRALTKDLIQDFFDYTKSNAYAHRYLNIDREDIQIRRLMAFGRRYVFFSTFSIDSLAGEQIHNDPVRVHDCIREYCKENNMIEDGEIIGSSTHYPSGSGLVVLSKYNIAIMELLARRKHKIVVDMRSKIFRDKRFGNSPLSPNNVVNDAKHLLLTEDPGGYMNRGDNFEKVNIILVDNDRVRVALDVDACKKQLNEINEAMTREDIDNFFV